MPGVKSINYMAAIQCQAEAQSRQAIEAIYLDRDGYLQEGTTSNFFAFREGTLLTPPSNRILPGITRQVVLKLAEKHFPIVERQIHRDEIRLFDEAFLTSSTKEVVPIVAIDSVVIGNGKPGKNTKRILKLFTDYTSKYRG
jgi:branched-chain amino acid aminotransferase